MNIAEATTAVSFGVWAVWESRDTFRAFFQEAAAIHEAEQEKEMREAADKDRDYWAAEAQRYEGEVRTLNHALDMCGETRGYWEKRASREKQRASGPVGRMAADWADTIEAATGKNPIPPGETAGYNEQAREHGWRKA